jgi:hypothetical protein
MDDFAPYLYRTTDYGVTWHKIVNGIPAREFTRAIREDLVRPGLLYAATERGMYLSYDAGEHWQSFQRNLPPVAVHDIALRDDDIVIATMGRGFYAMEGIGTIREADSASSRVAHLYQPGAAYRSAGAVHVEYALGPDGAGKVVTLELLDTHGGILQKASSTDSVPAGRGGRGGRGGGAPPPRVTNREGFNSFPLPMRYPNGTDFRGAVYWGGSGLNGPVPAPGRYTVRLTVGSEPPLSRTV